MPKRKNRNFKRRRRKMWVKNSECFYCKKSLLLEESTIDHVIPVAKGGTSHVSNLVLSCKRCNGTKGSKTIMEFIDYIKYHG